jgi:hypothetical protein
VDGNDEHDGRERENDDVKEGVDEVREQDEDIFEVEDY